jgi:hypothetical protein
MEALSFSDVNACSHSLEQLLPTLLFYLLHCTFYLTTFV